MFGAAQKPLHD
jgi:hypothetical protein